MSPSRSQKTPSPPIKSQAERFREAARQLGADESEDALDRAMDRLDLKAKPKPEDEKKTPKGG